MNSIKNIKAVIIGASGYTGAELVRLLYGHPQVEIVALVADSSAGQPIGFIYPHFMQLDLPELVKLDAVDLNNADVAFCCLPHGTSVEIITKLYNDFPALKIIDLSADFRLNDGNVYREWYGAVHTSQDLLELAVYGLSELYGDAIKNARLVACPGCYPTSAIVPLSPLLAKGIISHEGIIIDAKSGISGAGRMAKQENLFAEIQGNIRPYGIGGHRHVSEIEQDFTLAAGKDVVVTFTPQVIPMNRGILSTIYVTIGDGMSVSDIRKIWDDMYNEASFISVADDDHIPTAREVYGTNQCLMNVFKDRIPGRAIIVSVIDNLMKGASGQAVQNMNVMFDLPETAGLEQIAVFP